MTITQIENGIKKLLKNFSQDNFIFEFLLAYGEPKATITRLQKGELNQLESNGELTLRKKLFFKEATTGLHGIIDTLRTDSATQKQKPRFIIVTDYKTFLAYDTKTTDTLDIDINELAKHYDFFLPLAGMEKSTHIDENPADVKASNKLAKLYDEILKNNPTTTHEEVHALNVFLTRLLFCYFAEDSNIFDDNVFTEAISSHTQVDGSDLDTYLDRLFDVFNTDTKDREADLPAYLKAFPYVNGGLFRDKQPIPKFTTKSRSILIDIGTLDWSEINPDIFGSMIQAVVTPEHRGDMGMHYTSVPNIMKVIQPLFLDELYEEFEKSKTSKTKLESLLDRLTKIKIFDPACGSGNFLIIAYKELRKLEIKILQQINRVSNMKQGELFEQKKKREQQSFLSLSSGIELTQFSGIELDDFAHEVAILSMWLTEHQMNIEFFQEFGETAPPLPLKNGGNIVHGNATRLDWEEVSPKNEKNEIYILGNPPYLGTRNQEKEHKEDMAYVFKGIKNYKNLDYIACWFLKAAQYIQGFNAKYAFVTTNSITQGDQVAILWSKIFDFNLEINFAYQSFKWQNNAKNNAGVTVVIIGISNNNNYEKKLYTGKLVKKVKEINGYLIAAPKVFVGRRNKPLVEIPKMSYGNYTGGCNELLLSPREKEDILKESTVAEKFIRKLSGSAEFIQNKERYCLWIVKKEDLEEALKIDNIVKRIAQVKQNRLNSKDTALNKLADRPHQFRDLKEAKSSSIIVPIVSSERRKYIPMGFLDKEYIIPNSAQAIYDAEPWIFAFLTSYMHNIWVKAVGGSLETRIRYSSVLCYNTFPFPEISDKHKEDLTELVFNILDVREQHTEKTLAQMYDPDKMPKELKEAHHQLDLAIEKCYRNKPFENDEERLEYLFKLYEEMIENE